MSTTDVTPHDAPEQRPGVRPGPLSPHRTDLVALVFGLGFLVIGLISLSHQLDWFGGEDRDFGGIVLAAIGGIGVVAVLAAGLRRSRPAPSDAVPQPTSTPDDATDS